MEATASGMHSWGSRGRRFKSGRPDWQIDFFEYTSIPLEPSKEPFHREMALQRRALIACHHVPSGHLSVRQNRRTRWSRGQRSPSPPRICTATPTTANRRAPSPAAPANRKPDAHRTAAAAGRGQAWAWSPPGPGRRDHRFSWLVVAVGAADPVVGVAQLVLGDVRGTVVWCKHQVVLEQHGPERPAGRGPQAVA